MRMKKRNLWLLALCILVLSTTTIFTVAVSAVTPTPVMYTLTVNPLGIQCPVDVNPPGVSITARTTFSYPAGTAVTLKANSYIGPNGTGYYFGHWSGSVTSYQNPITIIMNSNKSLTPMYAVGDPIPTQIRRVTPTVTRRPATPTPTQRGGIIVTYVIQSDWGTGATAGITIKNATPEPIPAGWQLVWMVSDGVKIGPVWGPISIIQEGNKVTATGSMSIAANGGTVNFGFNMTYSGTNVKPSAFTLNGVPCVVQ